jgi:hypothetical protein
MGTRLGRIVPVLVAPVVAVILVAPGSVMAAPSAVDDTEPASDNQVDVNDVLLGDLGSGWALTLDESDGEGGVTRVWDGPLGSLMISAQPLVAGTDPAVVIEFLVGAQPGTEAIDEPSLEHAAWIVPTGTIAGDDGTATLMMVTADYVFWFWLWGSSSESVAGLVEVASGHADLAAQRAIDAEPDSVPDTSRRVDDATLLALLPDVPPEGFGLFPVWAPIGDAVSSPQAGTASDVLQFLDESSKQVGRVWLGERMALAVSITEYPYEIFASSALVNPYIDARLPLLLEQGVLPPDAVAFEEPESLHVMAMFRSDRRLVFVSVTYLQPVARAEAIDLAVAASASVDALLPPGDTAAHDFPGQPVRIVGLILASAAVTAMIAGSRGIAAWRARRVRQTWAALEPPVPLPPPGSLPNVVVDLDPDARALRRWGRALIVVQVVTVNIGVVALAGGFGMLGVVVATSSFVVGVGFSRWWAARERGLIGPTVSDRDRVMPRLSGLLLGFLAFAQFGVGVAALIRGARYVILKPTLAQLELADRWSVEPRTLGYLHAIAGLAFIAVGAVVFRLARSLSRAHARRVLEADPRPPALYLRSFADDALSLPTIASARRPFFEMFSLRGADPFEEAVAWELDTYGPVVAVGMPGGSLRSLGAAREHLDHATWREEIARRMETAAVIVMAPGETAGLEWELGQVIRGGHLARTVFVFPPTSPIELAHRWRHSADIMRRHGATVGELAVSYSSVHTITIGAVGGLRVTTASTRDEATYRTAVDRALETVVAARPHTEAASSEPPALVGSGAGL